jgi:hypothetical protein
MKPLELLLSRAGEHEMLEIKKTVVPFDERDIIELERIVTDDDKKEALLFIKKVIYDRILHTQQGKLKSHLDAANPVEGFTKHIE